MMKFYQWTIVVLFLFVGTMSQAQSQQDAAIKFLERNLDKWELKASDISEIRLQDMYTDEHNKLTHVYLMQQFNGVDIHNASINISVKEDNSVLVAFSRFERNVQQRINTTSPIISAEQAVIKFVESLGIEFNEELNTIAQTENNGVVFGKTSFSHTDIKVTPVYQTVNSAIRLAWDVEFDQLGSADYWSVRMDAVTGDVIEQHNYTVYCSYGDESHSHTSECDVEILDLSSSSSALTTPNSYAVFALPAESPIHGPRVVVTTPWDVDASPFGWHDTDGIDDDPEFTITRGNNVHAYADENATNSPSQAEPEGGADLEFDDFVYDVNSEPIDMHDAVITNLFYMNNMIHDFTYCYGFDESSGNFQQNNYGNGGASTDPVSAEGIDGSGTNNANFATPPDGGNPRMQMFLWGATGGIFFVDEPVEIEGAYSVGTAAFGPIIGPIAVTGDVAYAFDGSQTPTHCCQAITNPDQINGKVALIDRGTCFFSDKVVNAENAGAIGVIICNFEDNTINMADGGSGGSVTIPSVMLSSSDCQKIKMRIDDGTNVIARFQDAPNSGPNQLPGSFDNGIIAHEYGHGVSNRLTGGPNNTGCLSNDEQMGEGWSDWLALVMTVDPGDAGTDSRGIGTYALSQGINGGGIRNYPYSTDMEIYPSTHADIIGTGSPHALGEVWAATLWDLYWKLVDEYGYDEDCTDRGAGNNIAIQLVIDGMKLQPCNPGMLDGRDAIIAADEANNGGNNFCLIWEVFARRGMGFFSDQGSVFDRNDNVEDFSTFPPCLNKILITKDGPGFIDAGDDIPVVLSVTNYKFDPVTGVVVTDEIPEGANVLAGSITNDGVLDGDIITWTLGELQVEELVTLNYTLESSSSLTSATIWLDDIEDGDGQWLLDFPSNQGENLHFVVDNEVHSGEKAIFFFDLEEASDAALLTVESFSLDVDRPVLRLWQKFITEPVADGAMAEISVDNGDTWSFLTIDKTFRNGYTGSLQYGTLVIPFLDAWSGDSDGWVDSWIDLSEYAGQDVKIRLRFATDDNTGSLGGWWFDDVELMDLFSYQAQACVTSDDGDNECVSFAGEGVLVESEFVDATEDGLAGVDYNLFPNPADNVINISITSEKTEEAVISLQTVNGKSIMAQNETLTETNQLIQLNVNSVTPGIYILKIQTKSGQITNKVIIQK